jgi:hypothetical protein
VAWFGRANGQSLPAKLRLLKQGAHFISPTLDQRSFGAFAPFGLGIDQLRPTEIDLGIGWDISIIFNPRLIQLSPELPIATVQTVHPDGFEGEAIDHSALDHDPG